MKIIKIGYKVVDTQLRSLTKPCLLLNDAGIQYLENRWVVPRHPDLPLFVFETKEDAQRFIGKERFYFIYKCKYVCSERTITRFSSTGLVKNILQDQQKSHHLQMNWPKGTVFASHVKLLEREDNE